MSSSADTIIGEMDIEGLRQDFHRIVDIHHFLCPFVFDFEPLSS